MTNLPSFAATADYSSHIDRNVTHLPSPDDDVISGPAGAGDANVSPGAVPEPRSAEHRALHRIQGAQRVQQPEQPGISWSSGGAIPGGDAIPLLPKSALPRSAPAIMAISDGSCLATLARSGSDMKIVAYQMTLLVESSGHVLTPQLRRELHSEFGAAHLP